MGVAQKDRKWVVVFVACFLGLVVDGMDLQFLSLTLPIFDGGIPNF